MTDPSGRQDRLGNGHGGMGPTPQTFAGANGGMGIQLDEPKHQVMNTSEQSAPEAILSGLANLLSKPSHKQNQKAQEYDGTQDFDDYMASFNVIKEWNGWSETQSAQQLVMALRDQAKQAWNTKCEGKIPPFNELVKILRDRFEPEGHKELHRAEFQNRRKRTDESFLEYSHALKKQATKSHKEYPENLRDDIVKDQIIRGLESDEIIFVKARNATSLDAVITALTEYETTKKCGKTPFTPKPRQVANIGTLGDDRASNAILDLLQLVGAQQNQTTDRKPRNAPKDNSKKTCWRCGEVGHIQYKCPQYAAEVAAGSIIPPRNWKPPQGAPQNANMPRPLASQMGNTPGYPQQMSQSQATGSLAQTQRPGLDLNAAIFTPSSGQGNALNTAAGTANAPESTGNPLLPFP